jgi:hypothetical protein
VYGVVLAKQLEEKLATLNASLGDTDAFDRAARSLLDAAATARPDKNYPPPKDNRDTGLDDAMERLRRALEKLKNLPTRVRTLVPYCCWCLELILRWCVCAQQKDSPAVKEVTAALPEILREIAKNDPGACRSSVFASSF